MFFNAHSKSTGTYNNKSTTKCKEIDSKNTKIMGSILNNLVLNELWYLGVILRIKSYLYLFLYHIKISNVTDKLVYGT